LTNDRISAAETEWLEQMLYAADRIDESERKFLHELKGEAKEASPEFEAMFKRCMKEPVKA
jgi:hypothetical protein